MYRYLTLFFTIFLLCALAAFAQPRGSADIVSIEGKLSVEQVVAGEEFKLALILDIEDKWHINADRFMEKLRLASERNF